MAVTAYKLYVQLLAIRRSMEVEAGREVPSPDEIQTQVLEVINDFNLAWLKASNDEEGKRRVVQMAYEIAEKLPVAEGGTIILRVRRLGVSPELPKKRRKAPNGLFNAEMLLRNPRLMLLVLMMGMLLFLAYKLNKVNRAKVPVNVEQGE